MAVSTGRATMAELATVLSVENLHDILEIVTIDGYNAHLWKKWHDSHGGNR